MATAGRSSEMLMLLCVGNQSIRDVVLDGCAGGIVDDSIHVYSSIDCNRGGGDTSGGCGLVLLG